MTARLSGRHGRPGPGRPRKPKGAGTVLSLGAMRKLSRVLRGAQYRAADYLIRRTGWSLPGYGELAVATVLRELRIGKAHLYRVRAALQHVVKSRMVGGRLFFWSEYGATARASQRLHESWWTALYTHEREGKPFARELRAFLVRQERLQRELFDAGAANETRPRNPEQSSVSSRAASELEAPPMPMAAGAEELCGPFVGRNPEQSSVSSRASAQVADERASFPDEEPLTGDGYAPIPERFRVYSHVFTPRTSERAAFLEDLQISRGFWSATPLAKMLAPLASIPERFSVFTRSLACTKQEERSKTETEIQAATSLSAEIVNPPPSGTARGWTARRNDDPIVKAAEADRPADEGDGGVEGSEGERESPVPASSGSVTADHVADEGQVREHPSGTRLRAARRDETMTREESLEALAALERGELQLPARPVPAPPLNPSTGLQPLGEPQPIVGEARPRRLAKAKPSEATLRDFGEAFVAAMKAFHPAWEPRKTEEEAAAAREYFHAHIKGRSVSWMQRWVDANVRRFAAEVRRDGHKVANFGKFLKHEGVHAPPPPPDKAFAGYELGSGAPPPDELFAALGLERKAQ